MEDKKSFKVNCNVQKNDTTLKQNETSIINRLISLRNSIKPFYQSKQPDLILMKNLLVSSKSEFLSGYFAACTSITILFPLNKIIFRQILEDISFKEAFKQLKTEGITNVYRGLLPPLLQKSTSYSIMFGSQNEYYLLLKKLAEDSNSEFIKSIGPEARHLTNTSIAAGLAGLTEATLTPFERIQAVLQMQQFQTTYRHTLHAFQDIVKKNSYWELYRGFSAICLRNSFSNALFFTMRTPLKSVFPHAKTKLENSFYDFVSGGLLGATISTIIYPLNVVKSHMQARVGGKYYSMSQAFWMTYESRDRKWSFMYRGVSSNFTRAVFAWGITNMSYEYALNLLR